MNRNRKHKPVVFSVEVVEVISPDVFDIAGVHEAVAVWRCFDEHHRGQIVDVPVGRDLDQTGLFAFGQGFHPCVWVFGVVNTGPLVARSEIVWHAVMMAHAVVVFDAVSEEELAAFLACLPPEKG